MQSRDVISWLATQCRNGTTAAQRHKQRKRSFEAWGGMFKYIGQITKSDIAVLPRMCDAMDGV